MRTYRRYLLVGMLTIALAAIAAGCGGDDGGGDGNVSGSLAVTAIWTGPEQEAFEAVLAGFTEVNPDVEVKYTSGGDQLVTQLSTAVEGGNPPDIAVLGQPGLVRDFAAKDALQPLDFASADIEANLGTSAVDLGTVDGTLYGFLFKAANKSTV